MVHADGFTGFNRLAPFIGDVHSTQYGTLRCRKREPSTPSMANHGSIKDAMAKHAVPPDQPTLHADRGTAMEAKATALMLADPGVVKSLGQAAHLKRQPVLGSPLQDAEISAGIPQTVPNHH